MTENTTLTSRETEILALVAEGKSNKEIAAELFISINTVKVHISNIFQKIEVSSRTEATLFAIENGVVESPASSTQPQEGTTPDISAKVSEEQPAEQSNWLKKNWWVLLFVFVVLFVITQATLPSLSFFRSVPTPNPVVEALNKNRMEALKPMQTARLGFASVINENEIYIIGGKSGTEAVGLTEKYLIDTDSWESLPAKPTAVTDVAAVFLRGSIYVPGGKLNDGSLTDSLEVLNLNEKKWEVKASIPKRISNYALASFEGQLFLIGGWDGESVVDNVFRYDPSLDEWFSCAPMPTARMDASATVLAGQILVIGGSNGDEGLVNNEGYKPSFAEDDGGEWEQNDDLPFECAFCSSTSLSDQMFVLASDRIWQYSNGTRRWSQIMLNNDQLLPTHVRSIVSPDGSLYIFGGISPDGNPANFAVKYRVIYTISIPNVINE